MIRDELKAFITEIYSVEAEHPWLDEPDYEVFRHSDNRKWFALIMDVPRNRLGLPGEMPLDIVNLKCDPLLIGLLRNEEGFFPAYHMSKDRWISAALDGTAADDKIRMLLEMSYRATAQKVRKRRMHAKSEDEL